MNYCFYHFSDEDTEARKVLPCQVIIFKGKRMLLQKKKKISDSLVVQMVKNLPAIQETWVWSLGQEDPLENGMATYLSIIA